MISSTLYHRGLFPVWAQPSMDRNDGALWNAPLSDQPGLANIYNDQLASNLAYAGNNILPTPETHEMRKARLARIGVTEVFNQRP